MSTAAGSNIELRERTASTPAVPSHGTSSSFHRPAAYQRSGSLSTSASAAAAAAAAYYTPPSARVPYPAAPDTIFIMKPLVGAMQAWSW